MRNRPSCASRPSKKAIQFFRNGFFGEAYTHLIHTREISIRKGQTMAGDWIRRIPCRCTAGSSIVSSTILPYRSPRPTTGCFINNCASSTSLSALWITKRGGQSRSILELFDHSAPHTFFIFVQFSLEIPQFPTTILRLCPFGKNSNIFLHVSCIYDVMRYGSATILTRFICYWG